jgi:hypothetical protein
VRFQRRALGTAAVAALVIVVVVAGAGAYFFVLGPGLGTGGTNPTTSTTSTSSKTTTSTASSTTSLQSTFTTTQSGTSSTGTETTSTSCTTTTESTTSGGSSNFLDFTPFFSAYSEMAVHFNGTSNGSYSVISSDYHVVSSSSDEFKVDISQQTNGTSAQYTAWVFKNGTAAAVEYQGQNYTGFDAYVYFEAAMSAYLFESTFATPSVLSSLTDPSFVHEASQSTVMIGPSQVAVTDYVANATPVVIDSCGFSGSFSQFSIQTGVVSGESTSLLTSMTIDGSMNSSGSTQSFDFSLSLTSITKA